MIQVVRSPALVPRLARKPLWLPALSIVALSLSLPLPGAAQGQTGATPDSEEMPVFDLIYVEDPPEDISASPDPEHDPEHETARAPAAAPSDPPPDLPLVATRAPADRHLTPAPDLPDLSSAMPADPVMRLASLSPPKAFGTEPDPRRRIIGTDVTSPDEPDADPEIDPDKDPIELATALQTELQRVGCYRMGIDGQWGPGSRRALRNYLTRSDQSATGEEPTPEILQMVRASEGEVCPAPVAQAPRETQPARTTPTPSAPASPPRQASPAPAPEPAPSTGGGSRLEGAIRGGFR